MVDERRARSACAGYGDEIIGGMGVPSGAGVMPMLTRHSVEMPLTPPPLPACPLAHTYNAGAWGEVMCVLMLVRGRSASLPSGAAVCAWTRGAGGGMGAVSGEWAGYRGLQGQGSGGRRRECDGVAGTREATQTPTAACAREMALGVERNEARRRNEGSAEEGGGAYCWVHAGVCAIMRQRSVHPQPPPTRCWSSTSHTRRLSVARRDTPRRGCSAYPRLAARLRPGPGPWAGSPTRGTC